jgi:outer membrane murein-binding lipoprotein Lpp
MRTDRGNRGGMRGRMFLGAAMLAAVLIAVPSAATTLEELKAQIEALRQKVEELEAETSRAAPPPEVPAPTGAKSDAIVRGEGGGAFNFYVPSMDTSVRIGGYVKGDMVYSDVSAGDNSDSDLNFYPRSIPVGPRADSQNDKIALTAKQSRLFFMTRTPTDWGDFKIHLEGDFYGTGGNQVVSNSSTWRLRHAYGELGNFLFGQTWSTFMNVGALPETLDFGGPAAELFIRQSQIRWTQPFDWGNFQISLENPETFLNPGGSGVSATPDDDRFPDLVARVNAKLPFGAFSLAGMGRELRIDTDVARDNVYTGAVSLAGVVPTFGKDDFRFMLNYGNGLGRYMYTNFEDGVYDAADDEIDPVDQWGGFVAYRHFWIGSLRSSLAYSYGEADNDVDLTGDAANKRFQSVHANLIWSPIPPVNVGIEYLWGERELESGDGGELNRVQFSAQYSF